MDAPFTIKLQNLLLYFVNFMLLATVILFLPVRPLKISGFYVFFV